MRKIELGSLSVLSLLLATTGAAGCRQEVESTDVRTSGVYPDIDVRAEGSGSTRVQVKLRVGGPVSNTFLELVGKDRLTATAGGVTKELDNNGLAYAATFPGDAAGSIVVAFMRGDADVSAPNTTVNLPAPFTLTLGAQELSRAAGDLAFTWSPASGTGDVDVSADGRCVGLHLETTPDDGSSSISGDQLHAQNVDDACQVVLTLARTQSGEVDPAFTEGGRVHAHQIRSASFTSTP